MRSVNLTKYYKATFVTQLKKVCNVKFVSKIKSLQTKSEVFLFANVHILFEKIPEVGAGVIFLHCFYDENFKS